MQLHVQPAASSSSLEPVRFFLGESELAVVKITDRWPGAGHVYFKLEADDGNTYILKHEDADDRWEMTFFQVGSRN